MTDNGSAYRSDLWAAVIAEHKLRPIRTRPYRPQINGKAERFIQILLREWAYARTYRSSDHRARTLPGWTHRYNSQRAHGSLEGQAPITRIAA
jgi:transposase InsO family protein